jgi:peptide/nickel transport system ATP-binding protein
MNALFRIRDLNVSFLTQKGPLQVIDNISLDMQRGEVVAILGESGSGKSVVGHTIMRILDKNARVRGEIFFDRLDLLKVNEKAMEKVRGNRLTIVMQNPDLAFNPVIKIGKQLIEPLLIHHALDQKLADQRLKKILLRMGFENLDTLLSMYPHQLSGGMKQRLLIAAALETGPEMMIADEPTKGLDGVNRELIINELQKVRKMNGCSLIVITHDISLVARIADRVAVMYAGEIIEISPSGSFFKKPLHPYAVDLLNALPEKGFQPIRGQSPSLSQLPGGCRFHPRCQQKLPPCPCRKPAMVRVKTGMVKCIRY